MNWRKIWSPQFLPQVEDTIPPVQPHGLFAAGVVENTPTMHEAGGVSEGAPQVLPATFALDAEDTESLTSRNSAVARMEDVGGGGPLNNRRLMLVWDRDQDVPPEVRIAANLIRTLATRVGAVPHGGVIPGTIRRQRWCHIERSLDVGGRKAGGDVSFGGVVDLSDISDGRTHAFLWGRHGTVCGSESWLDGLSRSVIMGHGLVTTDSQPPDLAITSQQELKSIF